MRTVVPMTMLAMAVACECPPLAVQAQDTGPITAPQYKAGDTWVYDRTHDSRGKPFRQERVDQVIERVTQDSIVIGVKLDGAPGDFEDYILAPDLSERRIVDGRTVLVNRMQSFPMNIGSTWDEDYVDPRQQGVQTSARSRRTYKVVGWEDVAVPAGNFHALKIEASGTLVGQIFVPATASGAAVAAPTSGTVVSHIEKARSGTVSETTYLAAYYVPSIKRYVKTIDEKYNDQGLRVDRDISVLVSYKAAGDISPASTSASAH